MKKIKFSVLILLIFSIAANAQNDERVIGNYVENGTHYYIQKDNTFIIVGYATLITGKWNITNNNILTLTPKNPEAPFLLYGYHNPSIKGTKIMFTGFETDSPTFIGLNDSSMQRVFNENVNCTTFPYVHLFTEKGDKISFSQSTENTQENYNKVYTYKIDKDFNDFVAYYFPSSKFRKPIILKIKEKYLENRFQQKVEKIKNLNQEDLKMIEDINFEINNKDTVDLQYYNSSYNHISTDNFNINNYNFNKSINAFLVKKPQITQDAYHNLNVIFEYNRVRNMQVIDKKIVVNKKTLFHSECN